METKNNFSNILGVMLIVGVIIGLIYFVLNKIPSSGGNLPFDQSGVNDNTPVIENEYEQIRYQTEGRPSFGTDSGQFEEEI